MKLKSITAQRNLTKSKTVKQMDGSYAKREEQYGLTLTFDLTEGEHLRDENDVIKEVNDKVIWGMEDLQNPDRPDWLNEKSEGQKNMKPKRTVNRYKVAR